MVGEAVGQPRGQQGCDTCHERGDERWKDDLAHDLAGVDATHSGLHQHRPDETTEQRVGRAGRQPEQPGPEIPDDGPDETGEDHRYGDELIVDDATGDRLGDLRGQGRPEDVENGRDDDGHLGLECAGGHRGGHGVG